MSVPAQDFTFNEEAKKTENKKVEDCDDRSDNSFDAQESMAPEQLEKFQFGQNNAAEANQLDRYDNIDMQIIREQSNESQKKEKGEFKLLEDDQEIDVKN